MRNKIVGECIGQDAGRGPIKRGNGGYAGRFALDGDKGEEIQSVARCVAEGQSSWPV